MRTYDALNWMVSKTPPAGQETVGYDCDLSGLLLKASAASCAYAFGYDTAGRRVSETSPFFGTILDANGNRVTLSWPGTPGYSVNYAYDARDRLTGVYSGTQSADTRVVYLTYGMRGRWAGRCRRSHMPGRAVG